jgi:RNA 3'-terminal phosphate cyclase (ATP)
MIKIDGSEGEGGGQILRSSLSLSVWTQQAFRIFDIRANREPPGLKRQHLTAVKSAAEICDADVVGDHIGSRELIFRPGRLNCRNYSFNIGTAGSSTLVLQTVLPPLLMGADPSSVEIIGGTHNRGSPPFDFLQRAFIPLLQRMGADITLQLLRYGFYPRGGGQIRCEIRPARLHPLQLHERGALEQISADAYVAALPMNVAERELNAIGQSLDIPREHLHLQGLPNDMGPGNAVTITADFANVTEVFTGFGERGVLAENVAKAAASEAREYLDSSAPVGEHLADQLLLPLALAGSGSFVATAITDHLRSNAKVIAKFTDRRIDWRENEAGYLISVH